MPLETVDPIAELAMAGVVRASAYYLPRVDSVEVLPDTCPVADSHRKSAERELGIAGDPEHTYLKCFTVTHDGRRRWCPYYYGLADNHTHTERLDVSILRERCVETGARSTRCVVLCVGAQRNRPPGV